MEGSQTFSYSKIKKAKDIRRAAMILEISKDIFKKEVVDMINKMIFESKRSKPEITKDKSSVEIRILNKLLVDINKL